MKTALIPTSRPLHRRLLNQACVALAVFALSALAFTHRAAAQTYPNAFGATTLVPSSSTPAVPFHPLNQTATVGVPFSVDIAFAVAGAQPYGAGFGINAALSFDPTKLQVVSVAAAPASPWTTPIPGIPTTFDNVLGTLRYAGTGSAQGNRAFSVARIVFNPIAAGTSPIRFANVNEYLVGVGPWGVNGLAVNGTVTITAPQRFFTDPMTGASPNLEIPAAKYGPTPAGLRRNQSDNREDRPMVHTKAADYLAVANFTADLTVTLANDDLLYFGLGQGIADPAYHNEPSHAFYFRVHSRFDGHAYDIHSAVRNSPTSWLAISNIGTYALGSTITLRITRAGDTITLGIVGGGSASYSLSAMQAALGLDPTNTRIFFGNTSVGSLFTQLKISSDTTPPVITAPADIVREATGPAGAVVTFTATAVDNIDGAVAVAASPASGSMFPLATTSVGLAAADAAGNTATASFTVMVRDTTAPAVTVPGDITAEATGPGGAAVGYPAPTASDAVGVTSLASAPASGSTFPLGSTTVTATARDAAGNIGTGTFKVSVVDTIAPVLTVPANQILEATGPAGATASFSASATDVVGVASLTTSAASGSTFPIGTTTVAVTAKDAAGNSANGSFTITVRDTTAPALVSVTPSSATLWPPNHQMVAITIAAVATDVVGVTSLKIISVTSNEPDNGLGDGDTAGDIQITGDLKLNLRAERSGTGNGRVYTITVEARDAAGNATTRTCTVSVPKSQGRK